VPTTLRQLGDAALPDEQRARLASSLSPPAIRSANSPAVAAVLNSGKSASLRRAVIRNPGSNFGCPGGSLLIGRYPRLPLECRAVLNQLLKRSDWVSALLDAVQAGKINLVTLGPVAINHLRTFSDKDVAARANKIMMKFAGGLK